MADTDIPAEVMAQTRAAVAGQSTPMRFPAEDLYYYTIIKFVEYQRTNPKNPAIRVDQADIILPLPLNLREAYGISYADVEFDKLGGVVDAAAPIINNYLDTGGFKEGDDVAAVNAIQGLAQALSRRTAAAISNDLGGIIDRVTGTAVNPHITAVFYGVDLRSHQFAWRVSAKTPAESRSLRNILNYIRSHMHPTKKNDFLLNFPDEVYIKFFANDRAFLYPVFKSVITQLEVDNSSDNVKAFFAGSDEPVIVSFAIQLKEVEIATRETYDGLAGNAASNTAALTLPGEGAARVDALRNANGDVIGV